ncbi:MAG: hypothetical protein JF597_47195 [Streptomyces sp.]|uniref:hypothetical protein n=1 Tax=Streptomyces sp. TaxID=1931 RepID=UPI0026010C78|nr:hypothetical protein [Streptomyces sp.]MBW8800877.1 hypothetical protein [Streptomyces sp.]
MINALVLVLEPTASSRRLAGRGPGRHPFDWAAATEQQLGTRLPADYPHCEYWRQCPQAKSPHDLATATFESATARCIQMDIPATDEHPALLQRSLLNE